MIDGIEPLALPAEKASVYKLKKLLQFCPGRQLRRQDDLNLLSHLLYIALVEGDNQVLFAGKVQVDCSFRDPNTSSDLIHRCFMISPLRQHFLCCLEN